MQCNAIAGQREKNERPKNQITDSFHEISKDPEKLIEWLHEEKAISSPNQDQFDMAVQARNISRLLLKTPLKTVALVGEYGSGKSSIIKMVDYYLNPENRNKLNQNNRNDKDDSVDHRVDVVTCTVSGWGFAKGSTAEHILECAINELSRHVDVSGLRTIPEQYIAAMGSADNMFLKILAALATFWKSPLDILKKIDVVLTAINKRLIIFLEDVDRNNNDEVFFNEIAALLDSLRQLKQVSFVLAIGQKYDAEEILIKTAEHVENVPRLNRTDVLNALETFRLYCIERCPDIISTIPKNYNKDRMGWGRPEILQIVAETDDGLSQPVDAILELTDNPRVFKHTLRRTLTAWEKLAGEIDFDDLLIVNVLKVVDERIFSFIDKHIARLCALAKEDKKEKIDELRKKLNPEYARATENAEYDISAVSKLVNALFPEFSDERTDWSLHQDLTKYQHVANDEPTEYWERIKRGELHDNEIKDYEILRALREWNKDHESKSFRGMEFVEALSNDERVDKKVHQFKNILNHGSLQKAASKQFGITLKEHGNKAGSKVCPAIAGWFTLAPENLDEQWKKWLLEEIKKALSISLRYAHELYYFWHNPEHNSDEVFRKRVVEEAKKIYENDPALLAKVLDPDYIWTMGEFIRSVEEKNENNRYSLNQWQWLGKALIKASADNPQIIGVQIAPMICYFSDYNREHQIEFQNNFDQRNVKSIFNNQEYMAMKLLLLEGVDIEKYDEQSQAVLRCVRDEATKWLKQNNSQAEDNKAL
ncbi:MAG: hypothetical protein JW749_05265 [Sedimentisphaerales bacterium]|nr:hypothetical protein [Sedimentisphaerales bacterium]